MPSPPAFSGYSASYGLTCFTKIRDDSYVSPLLANIALHGMETRVAQAFTYREGKPNFVRYADDFVVFHPTEAGVKKAKEVLETWLKDIGLELKPSKTRITHTLREYQGVVGFDFLGWTVRQFPVGKTHTGKAGHYGPPLGFKTLIRRESKRQ